MISELAVISEGLGALKTLGETLKTFSTLKGAKPDKNSVELADHVLAVRAALLNAQSEQAALIEKVRQQEEEIRELREWGADKRRYEMKRFHPGVIVYRLKDNDDSREPSHDLCAACYQKGVKSILQATSELKMRRRVSFCPACKNEIAYGAEERQENRPAKAASDWHPFDQI